jgi:hypothetical protein
LRELQLRHAQLQALEAAQEAERQRMATLAETERVKAVSALLGRTLASPAFGATELRCLGAAHVALDAQARAAAGVFEEAQRHVDARQAALYAADTALAVLDRDLASAQRKRQRELDELALRRTEDTGNTRRRRS